MRESFSRIGKSALFAARHYGRRLRATAFPGVAVLCYHGIRADDLPAGAATFEGLHVRSSELEAHCRLVQETCNPISLHQWRMALAGGPPLPARPVLFTFDDGYRTVFTLARPILERYSIPMVVFVCSETVAQQSLLWFDALARRFGEAEVERTKTLAYDEWATLTAVRVSPDDESDPNAPMAISDVKILAGVPGVEIGGHTASHPILARGDRKQQYAQIASNKGHLESWIGRLVTAFAYPNGRPGLDYTPESVKLVEELGFDFGFTTREAFATPAEPPLERSRFLMLAGISPAELGHRLTYSWPR